MPAGVLDSCKDVNKDKAVPEKIVTGGQDGMLKRKEQYAGTAEDYLDGDNVYSKRSLSDT